MPPIQLTTVREYYTRWHLNSFTLTDAYTGVNLMDTPWPIENSIGIFLMNTHASNDATILIGGRTSFPLLAGAAIDLPLVNVQLQSKNKTAGSNATIIVIYRWL